MDKLYKRKFRTFLGEAIALADDNFLLLLAFSNYKNLQKKLQYFSTKYEVLDKKNSILQDTENQLAEYIGKHRKNFDLPIKLIGSDFQKKIWSHLINIPFGETISYAELAKRFGNEKAYRACANANAANNLSIIIPCHRVIHSNGELGGYAGGIERKKMLLELEKATSDILYN